MHEGPYRFLRPPRCEKRGISTVQGAALQHSTQLRRLRVLRARNTFNEIEMVLQIGVELLSWTVELGPVLLLFCDLGLRLPLPTTERGSNT